MIKNELKGDIAENNSIKIIDDNMELEILNTSKLRGFAGETFKLL